MTAGDIVEVVSGRHTGRSGVVMETGDNRIEVALGGDTGWVPLDPAAVRLRTWKATP